MNMFEEIDSIKSDLPKFNTVTKNISNIKLNGYQRFAVIIYGICFCFGIILGNIFPVCGSSSNFYSTCTTTEFNFSLMVFFGLFLFWYVYSFLQ